MNEADFDELVGEGNLTADKMPSLLAPTAYGKIFMVHYAVQVSLKHPGIFSQPTQLEIDINLDTSKMDHLLYERLLGKIRDRANKMLLLNGP